MNGMNRDGHATWIWLVKCGGGIHKGGGLRRAGGE